MSCEFRFLSTFLCTFEHINELWPRALTKDRSTLLNALFGSFIRIVKHIPSYDLNWPLIARKYVSCGPFWHKTHERDLIYNGSRVLETVVEIIYSIEFYRTMSTIENTVCVTVLVFRAKL